MKLEPDQSSCGWIAPGGASHDTQAAVQHGAPRTCNFTPETDRVRDADGDQKYARLVALKARYDPADLFRLEPEHPGQPRGHDALARPSKLQETEARRQPRNPSGESSDPTPTVSTAIRPLYSRCKFRPDVQC